MTRDISIEPTALRARDQLVFDPIDVCAYVTPLAEERAHLGDAALLGILRAMMVVREFELMLDGFKREGEYRDLSYRHAGPAHLSIGQEAAAVGQAFLLGIDDHIFGSHRSHGEIVAKGLSALDGVADGQLERLAEEGSAGETLDVVDRHLAPADSAARAERFLLYGLLAEIFGRRAGFNRGMGGSMHAFYAPLGVYPNNAIVGASGPIAAGAALYKKVLDRPGIVIANIGDGALGCGPVWEAMNFASMGQFEQLWDEEHRGGLPVIFAFTNNFYAMGGQTLGETMGFDRLARVGAAINPANMRAETIDGNNPLAVIDAIRRKREVLEAGLGPVLLDVQCYRQSGHSSSDPGVYRSRQELDAWRQVDPIAEYADKLLAEGVLDESALDQVREEVTGRIREVAALAIDTTISPRVAGDHIGSFMFAGSSCDVNEFPERPFLIPRAESSRVRRLERLARFGRGDHGEQLPAGRAFTMRDALFEAVLEHFSRDATLVAYGEEHRDWDGAFGVYRGLTELLPHHRFFNAPISEAAIVGSAVGYAMEGGGALVELMYADFMGRAGDELFNQLAKWRAMSGGELRLRVVVRASVGAKYGAQHSQEWTALCAHVPGLQVVFPATPYDAKGLLASALSSDDPVVFFESQRHYDMPELFHPGGVPREYYTIPIGLPEIKRPGSDVTLLSIGPTLYRAAEAVDRLAELGVEAELIDARSLVPFDYEPVLSSLRKTGRIVLTSDACERGSFLATMAANIQRLGFDVLDAPAVVVGARNWITPPTEFDETFFPQPETIVDAIHNELIPLPGHRPMHDRDLVEEARQGV